MCVWRERALGVRWVCSQLCSPSRTSCTTSPLTCRLSRKCLLYFLGELVGHIFCQPLETTKANDAHGVFPGLKGSRQTPIRGSHATSHARKSPGLPPASQRLCLQSQVYPKGSPSSTVMVSLACHLARSGITMTAHLCAFLGGFATLV